MRHKSFIEKQGLQTARAETRNRTNSELKPVKETPKPQSPSYNHMKPTTRFNLMKIGSEIFLQSIEGYWFYSERFHSCRRRLPNVDYVRLMSNQGKS